MKIYYTIETNGRYCEESDEVMCGSVTFAYEPDLEELYEAVNKIVAKHYGISVEIAEKIIDNFDSDLSICEEMFEEEIKEYFEADAMEEYFGE